MGFDKLIIIALQSYSESLEKDLEKPPPSPWKLTPFAPFLPLGIYNTLELTVGEEIFSRTTHLGLN